ncbi:MAG: sugar phosphate isomerase/epimerase [Pirellulales bacterium]
MSESTRELTRRSALKNGFVAAITPVLFPASALGQTAIAKAQRPELRVGCLSWCFHSFDPGADPEEAIEIIGSLGFEGVELIVLAPDDLKTFWTDAKIDRLRAKLDRHKLHVAQVMLFQPVVEGLTSLDTKERTKSLDNFAAGCRIVEKLGSKMVDIVAPWPRELHGPSQPKYLPRYYDIEDPQPGQKFHIDLDPGFDWDRVWSTWIDTVRECVRRAKDFGLRFSIEHHTHCVVPDAASFLRLWDTVQDRHLGYSLDTGWTLIQREYPPVAIHKVKEQLMNVHIRDIDGHMRKFVHFGQGVMDVKAVVEALKQVGYRGFVSIEQDKHPGDMRQTCQRYLRAMREYISGG